MLARCREISREVAGVGGGGIVTGGTDADVTANIEVDARRRVCLRSAAESKS